MKKMVRKYLRRRLRKRDGSCVDDGRPRDGRGRNSTGRKGLGPGKGQGQNPGNGPGDGRCTK